jgi:hypothetical protein
VEARAVSSSGGVRPFSSAGEGAGAAAGGGGINVGRFGIERKKGAVGRGGDSVGEAGWSARLPWRRKEGGGEDGTAMCGDARPGWWLGPV